MIKFGVLKQEIINNNYLFFSGSKSDLNEYLMISTFSCPIYVTIQKDFSEYTISYFWTTEP